MALERIATLENEVQARLLSSLLDEEKVPHMLRTFHDSAYDGIFQTEKGWGYIVAPSEERDHILALIAGLKGGAGQ